MTMFSKQKMHLEMSMKHCDKNEKVFNSISGVQSLPTAKKKQFFKLSDL